MARRRGRTALGGTVVLDADGVSKAAAADHQVHAILVSARNRDARVIVSAVTLAEVLRGTPRDAAMYRVLTRVTELPVTPEIASRGRWTARIDRSIRGDGRCCRRRDCAAAAWPSAAGHERPERHGEPHRESVRHRRGGGLTATLTRSAPSARVPPAPPAGEARSIHTE